MDWLTSRSYWHATASSPEDFPRLDRPIETDVVIVGGGITGLTAALYLANSGRQVVILEAGKIGAGTTGGTSGHLEALPDQGVRKLIRDHGETAARTVTQARLAAIDQIENWSRDLDIDCDFQRVAACVFSETAEGAEELQRECEATRCLGLTATCGRTIGLPFSVAGGFRVERQARFHSQRYLQALARHLQAQGCLIFEHTPAQPPKDGEPCVVETEQAQVAASDVLVCTHSAYFGLSELDLRVAAYQSYVLAARVNSDICDALFWDDQRPYHYFRPASSQDRRLLLIGGEDHKTGQGDDERDAWARLEAYARRRFSIQSIEHRWSAELFEPADGLPYIGRVPFSRHLYVATGFSGTGLTFGTVAGELLADLVMQRPSDLADILTPSRLKPLASAPRMIAENFDAAKHFFVDRFGGSSLHSVDDVPRGEGRLVRFGGRHNAVYRDHHGTVHALSPVCTHAGCHVQWNDAEKTWDCPCHGGRFSPQGERLYGPPAKDLERRSLE
jgi:glycine/D-amino acid oxidase-like deaminating enzyme/nitrite reductase/ring-hydroxylating ferredoxin subunit